MKICNTCHTDKPLSEFNRHSTSKDGYMHLCRSCYNARTHYVRRRFNGGGGPVDVSDRTELRRERAVTARRAEDDEAWIAEGWALLRASREEASG